MSELEDRLNAVLSDPAQLSRLSEMAARLMGGSPDRGEDPPPEAGADRPGPVSRLLKSSGRSRGKPLLEALSPYLDEERRRRLERALRLASTARIAASALGQMGGDHGL